MFLQGEQQVGKHDSNTDYHKGRPEPGKKIAVGILRQVIVIPPGHALEPQDEDEETETATIKDAAELITKAIKQISLRNGDKWVLKAAIRPVVKRLDPTFDESNYGCRSFADLLKKHHDRFQVERGEHDHLVCMIE